MTDLLLIAPILVSFATAVAAYLARRSRARTRAIGLAGSAVLLAIAVVLLAEVWRLGPIAMQASAWPAPFGITIVADLFSAIMVLIAAIIGFAVTIYSLGDIEPDLEAAGYYGLYHVLIAGVCGAFLTGDLFNLYVWFEVMLMASFGLLVLGGSPAQIDGGIKYVSINLISTVMFLIAVAILYGLTGTLNMADLSVAVAEVEDDGLLTVVAILFVIGFGIKSAVFPLFFWLPASYHTPPVAVSAIFAALLTKVGVYALIRMFTLIFTHDVGFTHGLLLAIAGVTMVTGVLGAAAQNQVRSILSFHIVSQIGYMVMGLALFTPLGMVGSVFYLVHHIIVKANLFLVSGVMNRLAGSFQLGEIGGLWRFKPLVALLFMIPAFSLAGMPPLSGFWAKFVLIRASLSLDTGAGYLIAATALVVGLLTLFSMTKIWGEAFWKPHPAGDHGVAPRLTAGRSALLLAPIIGLAGLTLAIGLYAEPFYQVSLAAAEQLLSNEAYVAAVIGDGAVLAAAGSGR